MKESKTGNKAPKAISAGKDSVSKLTFEQSLDELEKIIEELEKDNLTLEEALRFFEKGVGMIRNCDSQLKNARGRLSELFKGENGEFLEKVLGLTLDSFLSGEDSDE